MPIRIFDQVAGIRDIRVAPQYTDHLNGVTRSGFPLEIFRL